MERLIDAAIERDSWNRHYPVGTPVRFWHGARIGEGRTSKTRSLAIVLGHGAVVVAVEGYPHGIPLTHVEPIDVEITPEQLAIAAALRAEVERAVPGTGTVGG